MYAFPKTSGGARRGVGGGGGTSIPSLTFLYFRINFYLFCFPQDAGMHICIGTPRNVSRLCDTFLFSFFRFINSERGITLLLGVDVTASKESSGSFCYRDFFFFCEVEGENGVERGRHTLHQ